MNKYLERIYNGIIKENPTLILVIGMCPTLAVTTSVSNGIGMGLSTMVVLVLSNLLISLLRPLISDSIRFPAFIVVIASFVTIVELVLKAYIPGLYEALGLYIPLIVVNCIIMGRAEAYASKASPLLFRPDPDELLPRDSRFRDVAGHQGDPVLLYADRNLCIRAGRFHRTRIPDCRYERAEDPEQQYKEGRGMRRRLHELREERLL